MFDIIAILIPIILAVCIVISIRILSDTKLRKHLSETQTDAEIIRILLETDQNNRKRSFLIWGVMTTFVGLALCLIGVLNLGSDSPLAYGLIFLATGLALLLYKSIAHKLKD
ncbi:hypothetical protein [Marinicella sp. W31]|uniref:hypothetical protein n=1 Tax=Marinicella sp. W31 TaxID=3023713 RepID=UPI0037583EBE